MPTVEEVYLAYNEAENAHDLERTGRLVAEDLVVEINGQPAISSADDDARANADLIRCYPDYRREVLEIVADDHRGAIRWRMCGTAAPSVADRLGPLDLHGCSFIEVAEGRIARARLYFAGSDLLRSLELASRGIGRS